MQSIFDSVMGVSHSGSPDHVRKEDRAAATRRWRERKKIEKKREISFNLPKFSLLILRQFMIENLQSFKMCVERKEEKKDF